MATIENDKLPTFGGVQQDAYTGGTTQGALPLSANDSGSATVPMGNKQMLSATSNVGSGVNWGGSDYKWGNPLKASLMSAQRGLSNFDASTANFGQWAQYFSAQGPSNTWNKDTWDLFNMVTSRGPKDWYRNNSWIGTQTAGDSRYFNINTDPGYVDVFAISKEYEPLTGYGGLNKRTYESAGRLYPLNIAATEYNPTSKMYKFAEDMYAITAKMQLEKEAALTKAYNNLVDYVNRGGLDQQYRNTPYTPHFGTADYGKRKDMNQRYEEKAFNQMLGLLGGRLDRSPNNLFGSVEGSKSVQPKTLEEIQALINTPLTNAGYSLDNLPTYNPSFTVGGVSTNSANMKGVPIDAGAQPWVNKFIGDEMAKQNLSSGPSTTIVGQNYSGDQYEEYRRKNPIFSQIIKG